MNLKRLAALSVAAIAAVALMAPMAQAATPAPGYSQFAGCPSPAENPIATGCLHATIKGGYFKMGSKNVPIEKPITLNGGINAENGNVSASPAGGLTAVKEKVPGGVIGLTGLTWLAEVLGSEALTLYAVTELAGVPNVSFAEEAVSLPVKVHLVNPVLGNSCYVGSVSNPIKLHLITGTTNPPLPNKPITGKNPEFGFSESPAIISLKNGSFVDNSFSAPGASGCTLTLFGFIPISLNGLVNLQAGLPAAAGNNATEQVIDQEIADQHNVYP